MSLSGKRLARACATQSLIVMLIAINYWQQMFRRPEWLAPCTLCFMHCILAAFLTAWAQLIFMPIIELPRSWLSKEYLGMNTEVCKKSGVVLPLRAYNWKGTIIVGFDHFCGWLGVPIGLHNRKFFVQFLFYGGILCIGGAVFSVIDVLHPAEAPPPTVDGAGVSMSMSKVLVTMVAPGAVLVSKWLLGFGEMVDLNVTIYAFTIMADSAVAAALLLFCAYHMHLVLTNRTTIDPTTTRWDCGRFANWCQVFGTEPAWWFVPLRGPGPASDGIHYPERQTHKYINHTPFGLTCDAM